MQFRMYLLKLSEKLCRELKLMMSSIKLLLHLPFVMFVIADLLLVILVIVACIALEKRKHIN